MNDDENKGLESAWKRPGLKLKIEGLSLSEEILKERHESIELKD